MIAFAQNTNAIVLDTDVVRRQIVQCWRMRRSAVVKIETRVMPGTTQGLAHQQALIERRAVVCALRPDGEPVHSGVNEEDRFTESVS